MSKDTTKIPDLSEGWICIYRKIREHWIWKDPQKLRMWIDLLLEVNHEDRKVNLGMQLFDCNRGQSIKSLQSWGHRWSVSKDFTRNFFTLLEKDGMILHENLVKITRITICNYDTYQLSLHDRPTQPKRSKDASQTQCGTNNNDNNDDNKITPLDLFEEFWNLYDKKNDKEVCKKKWEKLSENDKAAILRHVPAYIASTPEKLFRKAPKTYLSNRCWEDEELPSVKSTNPTGKVNPTQSQPSAAALQSAMEAGIFTKQ